MGGLGPGIGGLEWVVIGVVALVVVGPERLPGLLRQLGKWVAKARGMANEFRASFEDMARQSELDELRKEVEALRTGQNSPVRLGTDASAAFKDIKDEFDKPLFADTPSTVVPETVAEPAMTPAASEWPDGEPVMMPLATPSLAEAEPVKRAPKARSSARAAKVPVAKVSTAKAKAPAAKVAASKISGRPAASKAAASKAPAPKAAAKTRAPRNSKLDL
jgi:sec-independent protein translocase protein TatB